MNNLKSYFSSPVKCASVPTVMVGSPTTPTSIPLIVKAPRPDSKLILQNMEEVLNSVKKKHRQKHKRKRELKRQGISERGEKSERDEKGATSGENDSSARASEHSKNQKTPLRESTVQTKEHSSKHGRKSSKHVENEIKSPLKNSSIMSHFSAATPKESEPEKKPASKMNAFEVMMNARNKSIGSNTPGKEASQTNGLEGTDSSKRDVAKRKLALQEWAERKGGAKRKIEEESREEYIEYQMEQRAKRFKKMLVNGTSQSEAVPPSATGSRKSKKKETEEEKLNRLKKKPLKKRIKRISSTESVESEEVKKIEDPEFVAKLNSPIKKKDSLLGYFQVSPTVGIEETAIVVNEKTIIVKQPIVLLEVIDQLTVDNKLKVEDKPTVEDTSKSEDKNEVEHTTVADKPKVEEEAIENTPKLKAKKGRKRKQVPVSVPIEETLPVEELVSIEKPLAIEELSPTKHSQEVPISQNCETPNGRRPRRSCVGKAKYDYDLEASPEKPKTKLISKPNTPSVNSKKIVESAEPIIELDDDSIDESANKTPSRKLAPLFLKSMPKPTVDPEVLRARQKFLMSGVPEKMRLDMAKQKQFEQNYETSLEMLFPAISHVAQLDGWKAPKVTNSKVKFREPESIDDSPNKRLRKRRSFAQITDCNRRDFRSPPRNRILDTFRAPTIIENKRQIIKKWKAEFDKFPTFKCYNQLREKYRYFCALDTTLDTEQITESVMVTRRMRHSKKELKPDDEEEKPPPTAPNGELLFTEKYKPMSSDQVLVNLSPVNELKEFLSAWQNGRKTVDSLMDDSFQMDSSNSCSSSCNSVVLLGPESSGKSSAVFALANELNFNVLEINAGMKRTGKKLLQELQEATQSHQVAKDTNSRKSNLLKRSLSGLKRQPSDLPEILSTSDLSGSAKLSLILIEDADIIFDQHDAGFVDAIYTLSATSKRPVIIVANDPNCQHLQRLISKNSIRFNAPNVLNIAKYLSVVSLIENCPVELNDIMSLYLFNQKDLRRTILELQFYIQSGGDNVTQQQPLTPSLPVQFFASPVKSSRMSFEETTSDVSEGTQVCNQPKVDYYINKNCFEYFTVCQNFPHRVPYPVDFDLLATNLNDIFSVSKAFKPKESKRRNSRKLKSPKKSTENDNSCEQLETLCDFYENISIATSLQDINVEDRLNPNFEEEIAHSLVEAAITTNLNAGPCPYNLFDTPKECITLAPLLTSTCLKSKSSYSVDYEPMLRSICRSEKSRSTQERRGSRFYHYLRNSCFNMNSFSTEIFDRTCDVFTTETDKIDEGSC